MNIHCQRLIPQAFSQHAPHFGQRSPKDSQQALMHQAHTLRQAMLNNNCDQMKALFSENPDLGRLIFTLTEADSGYGMGDIILSEAIRLDQVDLRTAEVLIQHIPAYVSLLYAKEQRQAERRGLALSLEQEFKITLLESATER